MPVILVQREMGVQISADHTDFKQFRKNCTVTLWVKEKTEVILYILSIDAKKLPLNFSNL